MLVMDELLTPEDAARILRMSEDTVRLKLKTGEIKGFKLGRGSRSHWKIKREELKRYIDEQESQQN